MRKIIFIIFIFSAIWGIADAQGLAPKLGVSPPLFELNIERGQVFNEKVKVYNPGDMPLPIHIRPTDFTAEEDSGQILFDEQSQDISFASRFWFKIDNPDFILEPKEVQEIKFSIEVPKNAEPGGRYATLMLEPQLPSFYFEEDKPKVIPYVGILFLLSVDAEGSVRPGTPLTVVEFNIPEKFHLKGLENLIASVSAAEPSIFSIVESGSLPFTLRIKNNDIYHIKPFGKLVIYAGDSAENSSPRIVGQTEIKKLTILPGKVREFPVEFRPELPENFEKYLPAFISNFISRNLMWGKYTAVLELDNQLAESIEFWVFPWKTGLGTTIIFGLILFFVIRYRRRMRLALRVLFKND